MKKGIIAFLTVMCLVWLLLPSYAEATEAENYNISNYDRKIEIQQKWENIVKAKYVYVDSPSVTYPYNTGKVCSTCLNSGLSYLNYIRYVADLPSVTMKDTLNDQAQHGAVVMAANDVMSHYPEQPADMPDDFYEKGYNATKRSNISRQYRNSMYDSNGLNGLQNSLLMYMNDEDTENAKRVGHRRWLLNPRLLYVGFGYATSLTGYDYSATYVTDQSGNEMYYDYISWPVAGCHPTNLFGENIPWSITFNPDKYKIPDRDQIVIKITRSLDGKTWTINSNTSEEEFINNPYLVVESSNYGLTNAVIFHPGLTDFELYECIYTVDIEGIYTVGNEPATIHYEVDFFDVTKCIGPHNYKTKKKEPTCIEKGYTYYSCDCGDDYYDWINPLGHIDDDNDYYCNRCNEIYCNWENVQGHLDENNDNICERCHEIVEMLSTPYIRSIKIQDSGVKLSWYAVENATSYGIYRSLNDGEFVCLASTDELTYTDTTLQKSANYKYRVVCLNQYNVPISNYSYAEGVKWLEIPRITLTNKKNSIQLKWQKIDKAHNYRIYRKEENGSEEIIEYIWDLDVVTYEDKDVSAGKKYSYYIIATGSPDDSLYEEQSIVRLTNPSVKLTNQANSLKIKWDKVVGAKGYIVYRKTASGSYVKLETITNKNTLSYLDKTAKNGTIYIYKVIATNREYSSSFTTKTSVRITQPTITSTKNVKTKSIVIKWKKNSKASGYQVKYVTGNKTKTETIKKNSIVSKTIKKLTKGKTYKVYVRSYKTVNGTKYYSAWSAVKKVKISK